MAKTAVKKHEEEIKQNLCGICQKPLKLIKIIQNGKTKSGKTCDCGLFVGNKKIS